MDAEFAAHLEITQSAQYEKIAKRGIVYFADSYLLMAKRRHGGTANKLIRKYIPKNRISMTSPINE